MIDYSKIVSELEKELSEVMYRYSGQGFEPLYYEREIGQAIAAVNVINGHHVQDYIAKYERRQE